MQVTLTFNNDNQGEALLNFLKSLDFVSISDKKPTQIPNSQIHETQRRLDLIQEGKMKIRHWSDVQADIFQK